MFNAEIKLLYIVIYFKDSVLSLVRDMIFAVARAGYTVSAAGQRGFDNTFQYQLGIFSILTCTKFILGPRFCCSNMHAKESGHNFSQMLTRPRRHEAVLKILDCHPVIF